VQQKIRVVVIAPDLGPDLGWLADVDPRLEVVDGNALAQEIDGGKPLLESADVILLGYCTQLTPATEGLIGAEVLAAMKPSAVLINIARGEVVEEDALIAALQTGRTSRAWAIRAAMNPSNACSPRTFGGTSKGSP
jgi:D-isomer specific 2-hydroxyacid dehydrogenase, NAD binding domain